MSSALTSLTRRFAQFSFTHARLHSKDQTVLKSAVLLPQPWLHQTAIRGLASKARGNKKKDKETSKPASPSQNLQHEEWVRFQRSIAVDGFQTGQTTEVVDGKKTRGGKSVRKRREREANQKTGRPDHIAGSQYPAQWFSDEETERLLAEAYANLPKRAGKRGTRNLKRQKNRWFAVRKLHAKQKRFRILAHEKRMAKRSSTVKAVLAVKEEAPLVRKRDQAYQKHVLTKWTKAMEQKL